MPWRQEYPPYNDDDLVWVLEHAGWHIVEAGEEGQAVYRLTHQMLTDHYRCRAESRKTQGEIVAALTQGVSGANWLECDRYLWRHLAGHAAAAGKLDTLALDPGYLAVAEPKRLVQALASITDKRSRRFADIYRRVVDRLVGQLPIDRLPLIHMTAQMEAPDLADQLAPPVPTRWRCGWAHVRRSAPNQVIGRHSAQIRSISFGSFHNRPAVISGDSAGTIVRRFADTGEAIGPPLKGHEDAIASVSFASILGRQMVVSGSVDGTICVWDMETDGPAALVLAEPITPTTFCIESMHPDFAGSHARVRDRGHCALQDHSATWTRRVKNPDSG